MPHQFGAKKNGRQNLFQDFADPVLFSGKADFIIQRSLLPEPLP